MKQQPVVVLGAGSWGTALAMVLARNGAPTTLWDIDSDHIAALESGRCNARYLPGIPFPDLLNPMADLETALEGAEDIVVVVPCAGLVSLLTRMAAMRERRFRLCLACKGLEPESRELNHRVVGRILGDVEVAVLSGPSFANEVAAGLPTAVTVASEKLAIADYFSERFHNEFFRIYTHDDVIGVQVGGAVKNVMAIAAGIADGLGFGANTRAALITRGLAEITRLGIAMGGRQETFMGLAGLGDLVLTCTDNQSRNRRFGLALARGSDRETACREIGQVVEGIKTAQVVHALAQDYNVEMPISEQIYRVIYHNLPPREMVQALLMRDRKSELE